MKINCMIVEDEPKAMSLLIEYIEKVSYLDLIKTTDDPYEALEFAENHKVDLIFLDINLPDLSGLDLSDLIKGKTMVIFTTAYSEYAVESYEKNAVDYLLKPITFNRFLQAVKKSKDLFEAENKISAHAEESFFLKSGKKFIHLNWSDIYYIEGYKEYISVVTKENKTLIYKRMKEMESLSPDLIRVHNSFIINIEKIHKIEDNHIHILDKKVPIGKKYKDDFLIKLRKRLI